MGSMQWKKFDGDYLEFQCCLKNIFMLKKTNLTRFNFDFFYCFFGLMNELVSRYFKSVGKVFLNLVFSAPPPT